MPFEVLRGVMEPVAETDRTMSVRATGAVLKDGPFFPVGSWIFSPHPARNAAHMSAANAAATMMAESATSQHWIAARKTLAVGSPLIVKGKDGSRRSSVMINGKAYADGDYVSITHSGRRFTWKVVGLNDSDVLKLVRVRVRKVEEPDKDAAKEPEKGKTK